MPRQKALKPKTKKKYLVHGYPDKFQTIIEEFVWAYSPRQARFLVGERLKKRHGLTRIYMYDCQVTEVQSTPT